ncbi:hypothetical protein [Acidithiobacillus sulfuriphilus]|uniref:hypothetical protein n=1 Tax=Acidithiobacillus sulfuriphilus TaxID=1867749 RepID=UPI003F611FF4
MTLKYLIEYIGRKTIERSAMELTSVDDTGGITPENPNGLNLFHHQLVIRAQWVAALRAERLPSFPHSDGGQNDILAGMACLCGCQIDISFSIGNPRLVNHPKASDDYKDNIKNDFLPEQ